MRYRWKLLILLLLMTLVPMLVTRTFGVRAVGKLGDELIYRMTQNRTANIQHRLELLLNSYASLNWAGRKQIEMALILQTREVVRCLERQAPPPSGIYFAEDFNRGVRIPPDISISSTHFRIRSGGGVDFLKISKSYPVFKIAPGIEPAGFEDDIARLSTLTPLYKEISEQLQGLVSWHTVGFENGLYSSYPGHNGIPGKLDPRKQPWYTAASEKPISWSDPYVDPETRQIVIAATSRIDHPFKNIQGVTSLVVPIYKVFESVPFTPEIPLKTQAFMCYLTARPGTDSKGIRIYVREEYIDFKHRNWQTRLAPDWLMSADSDQYRGLLADFESKRGNVRKMPYKGKDSLWVYGPSNGGLFLVFITPYDQILEGNRVHQEYIRNLIGNLLAFTRYGMIAIFIVIVIAALTFSRTITRPIRALVESARRLANGEFDARVNISSRDEFGDMGKVFNSVGPRLKEHYQIRQSLAIAREVQQNFIPKSDPSVEGLDIAGRSIYCDETGGDYFDYLNIDETAGKISIVVGDVSDHGISSALLMTTARALLRQRSAMPGSLRQIVSDVNFQLAGDVEDSGRFMTMFYCRIDMQQKKLSWVRAGQDPAIIFDLQSDTLDLLSGKGLPLGVFDHSVYEELDRDIVSGQVIVIGTDGIWETTDRNGQFFGKDRLCRVIRSNSRKSAGEILAAIIAAVDEFRFPLDREDDITLVVVKIGPLSNELVI